MSDVERGRAPSVSYPVRPPTVSRVLQALLRLGRTYSRSDTVGTVCDSPDITTLNDVTCHVIKRSARINHRSFNQYILAPFTHVRRLAALPAASSEHGPATTPPTEWELGKRGGAIFPRDYVAAPIRRRRRAPALAFLSAVLSRLGDRTGRHSPNHCPQFYAHAKAIERFTRKSIFVGADGPRDHTHTHTRTHAHVRQSHIRSDAVRQRPAYTASFHQHYVTTFVAVCSE